MSGPRLKTWDGLQALLIHSGRCEHEGELIRLSVPPTSNHIYTNAQLYNYHGLHRSRFPNQPPLKLTLRARASHPAPLGTLGFGFWNDPFMLSGGGVLAAPNTVWFFYASPPSDMALAEGVPGWGWKAATLNAGQVPSLLLAPAALAAIALTRLPGLGRPVMTAARRVVQAHEALLSDVALTDWHDYELDWQTDSAVFRVDGVERLRSPAPPRGPLGFVTWIDNQYAIASRTGKFGFGLCATNEEQWLELEGLTLGGAG